MGPHVPLLRPGSVEASPSSEHTNRSEAQAGSGDERREAQRWSQRYALRLDTQMTGQNTSIPSRWSSIGTMNASPASFGSSHSPQGSVASYKPLRSARGSLSLGVSHGHN